MNVPVRPIPAEQWTTIGPSKYRPTKFRKKSKLILIWHLTLNKLSKHERKWLTYFNYNQTDYDFSFFKADKSYLLKNEKFRTFSDVIR